MMTQDAFATAYQTGFQATFRLLLSKGLVTEEAEEFAQAAWARGWEARYQLKDPDRVVPWVNSIALNNMCNEKRRSKRHDELDESRKHQQPPAPVMCKIDADKLLGKCSSLDRSLLLHRYAGGMDMEEIARRHGLSCVATRVRIHRTKLALRHFAEQAPAAMAA
jgi:DNA-directed RNA polymerase specialized sigma24 family protein